MGLKNFKVVFDSPNNKYFAGANVTGKVEFALDEPKKVRALSIKFVGEAKVEWTNSEHVRQSDGKTRFESVSYIGEEEYFTFKYDLVAGGNSEVEIPAGIYTYPFSCKLPPTIPSSFSGDLGGVRYTATATLHRPWWFDHTASAEFQVITPIDLNYNLNAKKPVKLEIEKSFCCCWCKSGPLQLVVCMPFAGFVPKQSVPITIEVDNASNVKVDNVKIFLNKVILWKVKIPTNKERKDKIELSRLTLEGVEPNGTKSWTQMLPIPNITALNLDQCAIINCNYNITVTATVSGFHCNLVAEVPVFIGTVPIYQETMRQQPTRGSLHFNPSAPEMPSTSPVGYVLKPNTEPYPGFYYPTINSTATEHQSLMSGQVPLKYGAFVA